MKTQLYILSVFLFAAITASSQGLDPVEWRFTSKKLDNQTYEVRISAEMEYPWHIYSQYTEDGGPVPTTIAFKGNPGVKFEGDPKEEGSLIEKYEEVFMVDTRYFEGMVDFVQVVQLENGSDRPVTLEGSVTFMACTDQQCLLPQEVEFNVKLN
ncbi:protein-disulfide reductase DsbD domain-containing protein [Sinomicrobium weinanense]|uniref:Sugar transporter n=1 Tax=Sinomicrobium weinanense TaxID=2842200 RepID=A0A926JPV2_9FLAO|nr:protein-disulfide reductase DsbD domain-containing protein [Sinomicrobium weinanense]MBC9795123.1 sugar transporter [Sinomicrobium weinanense]MBU3123745.1 hypothetical protein [Sinomicrobium weinanense]